MSVHYRHPEWIALQRRYLDSGLSVPNTRLFSIEGVDEGAFTEGETVLHSEDHYLVKFEELSATVMAQADPDDWLLFIDSDAFLLTDIRPLMQLGTDLVAVQRRENGDWHPHPCFTLVRASLWRDLGTGNWAEGTWITASGLPATEMGGTLLERVNAANVPWTKLTRVNSTGLHRLWFGVYGIDGRAPVVYHHGAGSRDRVSRSDLVARRQRPKEAWRRARWAMKDQRMEGLSLSLSDCVLGRSTEINRSLLAAMERDTDFWQYLL